MKWFIQGKKRKLFSLAIVVAVAIGWLFYLIQFQVLPPASIFLLDDIPSPQANQRILVFTPHPDDETLGAGGYIATAIHNGAFVAVALVTDGNKHGLKNQRYQEFDKSLHILGVAKSNEYFLNYPDGSLNRQDQTEMTQKFLQIVDRVHPDIILATTPQDTHPDHAVVGQVALAVSQQRHLIYYEYLIHYPGYPKPKKFSPDAYLLPPIKLVNFDKEWHRFMLSQAIEDEKQEALLQYRTQLRNPSLHELLFSLVRRNELFAVTPGSLSSPSPTP